MKLTTVFRTGILGLTTVGAHRDLLPDPHGLAHARDLHQQQHHHRGHPVAVRQIVQVHKQQMDQVQTVVPSSVVFHDTNVTTPTAALHNHTTTDSNGNGTGATGWPYEADNITACTAPNYQDTSPLRTHIIRDDCKDLLKKVLARAGYWEMAQWTGLPSNGTYLGLASEGTCQFAVSRILDEKLVHDQGQGAVYGNATINHNNNASSDVAIIGNKDVYNILHAAVYDFAYQSDEFYMDKMTTQGRVYCQFQHTANATLAFKLQYVDDDDDDDSN